MIERVKASTRVSASGHKSTVKAHTRRVVGRGNTSVVRHSRSRGTAPDLTKVGGSRGEEYQKKLEEKFAPKSGPGAPTAKDLDAIFKLVQNDIDITRAEFDHMVAHEPEKFNDGLCDFYAEVMQKKLKGSRYQTEDDHYQYLEKVGVKSAPKHTFLKHGGKFYDLEAPNGVDKVEQLPIYVRHKKRVEEVDARDAFKKSKAAETAAIHRGKLEQKARKVIVKQRAEAAKNNKPGPSYAPARQLEKAKLVKAIVKPTAQMKKDKRAFAADKIQGEKLRDVAEYAAETRNLQDKTRGKKFHTRLTAFTGPKRVHKKSTK